MDTGQGGATPDVFPCPAVGVCCVWPCAVVCSWWCASQPPTCPHTPHPTGLYRPPRCLYDAAASAGAALVIDNGSHTLRAG
jgi:hypothetical protein